MLVDTHRGYAYLLSLYVVMNWYIYLYEFCGNYKQRNYKYKNSINLFLF